MSDTNLVRLGGLWTQTKGTDVYFAGYLGQARMLVFKNGFKIAGSNEPDYIMYVTTNKPKPEPGSIAESNGPTEPE